LGEGREWVLDNDKIQIMNSAEKQELIQLFLQNKSKNLCQLLKGFRDIFLS